MRKLLIISLSLICFFTYCLFPLCSAENSTYGENWVNKDFTTSSDEYAGLKEFLQNNPLTEFQGDSYLTEEAYKLFELKPYYVSEYIENEIFNNIITDNYLWEIPTSYGGVVSVENKEGIFKIFSTQMPSEITKQRLPSVIDKQGVAKVIDSNQILSNIIDIKYTYIYEKTYISLVYIKTESEEFVIPYSERPEFSELEDGKLYTVKELFSILLGNGNIVQHTDNSTESVLSEGTTSSTQQIASNTPDTSSTFPIKEIIISVVLAVLILAAVFAWIIIKKRNKTIDSE